VTGVTGCQWISLAVGDDSWTDAASALPLTRSDRLVRQHSSRNHRGGRRPSNAAAAMTGLPTIRLCHSGIAVIMAWAFPAVTTSAAREPPIPTRTRRRVACRRHIKGNIWQETWRPAGRSAQSDAPLLRSRNNLKAISTVEKVRIGLSGTPLAGGQCDTGSEVPATNSFTAGADHRTGGGSEIPRLAGAHYRAT
jgi:hypothetical protein